MSYEKNGNGFFTVLKAVAFALAVSLLAVVVFACVLRVKPLSDRAVYFVNQVVKNLAVIVATLLFVRGEKGWLKGGAVGLLFTLVSYLTFSIVAHTFSLSALAVAELFVGLIAGAGAGAIAVNLR
ncbi:MAG: TIGR04086 family membrane protein [Clostridia bacterium]|nr:TIGR04086 family membrane protein [Clostridia bacterium]